MISSTAEEQRLRSDLALSLPTLGGSNSGVSASEPPLYYALEILPYSLGKAGTLLDQLVLMRLLSALMGGLTALFSYLFVREALPRFRWAWAVGGMSIALMPLLGTMSGAVNPDAMLYAVLAAIFFALARGFRRGLSRKLAIAIGALTAVGFLTKLNFIGVAPGVIMGLIVLTLRSVPAHGRAALISFASALAIAASPACAYLLVNLTSGKGGLGIVTSAIEGGNGKRLDLQALSYVWQFYLPRLPGMTREYFPGLLMARDIWFDRAVGLYGWLDTAFPVWVQDLALVPASLLALLCTRAGVAARSKLRTRLSELIVYMMMGAGLMALVGADSYLSLAQGGANYAQPRYLLPMLPLLAAVLALAARGAGRRWGPVVGSLIVVLFAAHDIFSQLLTVGRFYG